MIQYSLVVFSLFILLGAHASADDDDCLGTNRPVIGAERNSSDTYMASGREHLKGVLLEERASYMLHPLLQYVFFDKDSSVLPRRYNLLRYPGKTVDFKEENLSGTSLDRYYEILNIYGYRLRKYPNARIELVGCNDGSPAEKRRGLSKERVEAVYNYFKNIWGISADRMKITVRDLPKISSNTKDSLAIAENRRVELLCNTWEVIRPMEDTQAIHPDPDEIRLTMQHRPEAIARRIEITRDGKLWKVIIASPHESEVLWNLKNDAGSYPPDDQPLTIQLIVIYPNSKQCVSYPITVRIKKVGSKEIAPYYKPDTRIEVFPLILFPFDRYEAGAFNERIIRDSVLPRIQATSSLTIEGYDSNSLGEKKTSLIHQRVEEVGKRIKKGSRGAYPNLQFGGINDHPFLYSDTLPEGRFYNRCVRIVVSTPR